MDFPSKKKNYVLIRSQKYMFFLHFLIVFDVFILSVEKTSTVTRLFALEIKQKSLEKVWKQKYSVHFFDPMDSKAFSFKTEVTWIK